MFENNSHLIGSDKNTNHKHKLALCVDPMPYTKPSQETISVSGF